MEQALGRHHESGRQLEPVTVQNIFRLVGPYERFGRTRPFGLSRFVGLLRTL